MMTDRGNDHRRFEEYQYRTIGEAAVSHYALEGAAIEFVGHSDTIVYQVTHADGSGKSVVRVHYPMTPIRDARWCERDAIESELNWLLAIRRDCGIPVQEPVTGLDGSFVYALPLPNGESANVSVVGWVEGERLGDFTSEQAYQAGALVARLHNHGNQWAKPKGFTRPRDDAESLRQSIEVMHTAMQNGLVAEADYRILESTGERIVDIMEPIGKGERDWGLIHGDLNDGNWILHQDCLVPIDFGCCGFGYYASDMAWALHYNILARDRPRFLQGYRTVRELPTDFDSTISAFYLNVMIGAMAWWVFHPTHQKSIVSALPGLISGEFSPFLQGKPCLFMS